MNNVLKFTLVLACIVSIYCGAWSFIGWSVSSEAQVEVMPPTIQDLADTTVTILIEFPCKHQPPCCDRFKHMGFGSGVFISHGSFMTARHLFEDKPDGTKYSALYKGNEYFINEEHCVWLDPDSDLAMVDLYGVPPHPIAETMDGDPPLGGDVVMIGTPAYLSMAGYVTKGNICHVHAEKVIAGLPNFNDPELAEIWDRVVGTTCFTVHGNSGGPVFYQGKLAGIFVGFPDLRKFNKNYSIYVPIYEFGTCSKVEQVLE